MKSKQIKSGLLLALAAAIWGAAFVAQSAGMEYVEPFTFQCVRNFLGGLTLVVYLHTVGKGKKDSEENRKLLLLGGVFCGVALFVSESLQQFGLRETTVGKAGFLTALYIVIVPLLGLFFHKRASVRIWLGAGLAVAGMYLLCMTKGSFVLGRGEFLVFLCAIGFSFHILIIDYFSPLVNGVKMSCIQFFVCSFLSGIAMAFTEQPSLEGIWAARLPIAYAGILSCGVAYTLQILGQKQVPPTMASLILSMESVFSALAGWVILGQSLSGREIFGCALIFGAVLLSSLPAKNQDITSVHAS